MKYYSELEVEKLLEHLYQRLSLHVAPAEREKDIMLKEVADLIIEIKENTLEEIERMRGSPRM